MATSFECWQVIIISITLGKSSAQIFTRVLFLISVCDTRGVQDKVDCLREAEIMFRSQLVNKMFAILNFNRAAFLFAVIVEVLTIDVTNTLPCVD